MLDIELAVDLFKLSTEVTGAEWPDVSVAVSPCPTLRVIGALTERSNRKQDAKRKKQDASGAVSKVDASKITKKHRKFLETLPAEAIAGSEYEELLKADREWNEGKELGEVIAADVDGLAVRSAARRAGVVLIRSGAPRRPRALHSSGQGARRGGARKRCGDLIQRLQILVIPKLTLGFSEIRRA